MGFQDHLEALREAEAKAARSRAEAIDRHREAARRRAEALLPEVYEAVKVLRDDRERSERYLMAYVRDQMARHQGGVPSRDSSGFGAIVSARQEQEEVRWYQRTRFHTRVEFGGWWVRRNPFEFEIPLLGSPRVGSWSASVFRAGPKTTLEHFAAGAVYEYNVHHEGYVETKQSTAEEGFHRFLGDITRHLLILP
jgi:hypothetical protein